MTVEQNIAYGLKMRRKNRSEIAKEVCRISELLSITHILKQHPGTLSGGEKQRTALARALVLSPDVLLLDEPFSALDPVTKKSLHKELFEIHCNFRCTIMLVTHDFTEAQELAGRIGIMSNGRLQAVRSSDALFEPYEDENINRFLGLST
jgi:molybdate transport system ATP-binding protein